MKPKLFKSYYLSFLILIFCQGLSAQNSTIIQAGTTISKLSPFLIYSTRYDGIKFRPGINVGFLKCKKFRFSHDFRLRYGFLYQRIGEKFRRQIHVPAFHGQWSPDSPPIHIEARDVDVKFDTYFDELKVPLLVEYRIDNFSLMGGINIGYILGGKAGKGKLVPNNNQYQVNPETTNTSTIIIRRYDYTFSMGCSYRYKIFGFNLMYQQGLRFLDYEDLYPSLFESYSSSPFENRYPVSFKGNDGRVKPRSLVLSLELYFSHGKS